MAGIEDILGRLNRWITHLGQPMGPGRANPDNDMIYLLAQEKTIRIRLLSHQKTGLLMAVSEDLPGLVVHGRTVGEIEERLPSVVADLIEAGGS